MTNDQPNKPADVEFDLLGGGILVTNGNGTIWRVWETQTGPDDLQRCLCYSDRGDTAVIPRWQLTELTK